ncbi:hypothetical protein EV121DRAFT_263972 [Schizophyllum commune]
MALSVDVAYMWGIVISSFLYGELGSVYLVMFCIALYILLLPLQPSYRVRREPVNRVLVSVAVLMCIACTLPLFLEDLYHPPAIVTGVCFTVAAISTDALTVRASRTSCIAVLIKLLADLLTLHMIWARNIRVCVAPAITLAGMMGLIIVRFTKRDRAQPESARGVGGIRLVITVIIESTLIYSGTKFINLMLLIAQSNVSYTFFCIVRL